MEDVDEVVKIEKTRIRVECDAFLRWRWRWLISIYVTFFIPLLFLGPSKVLSISFKSHCQLIVWLSMNFAGFVYVAGATCERKNPLSSRKESNGISHLYSVSDFRLTRICKFASRCSNHVFYRSSLDFGGQCIHRTNHNL